MYIDLVYKFGGNDFVYEANVSRNTLFAYYKHLVGDYTFTTWTPQKQIGFERCFDLIYMEDVFTADKFINDEDFLTWLADYERDNAKREWEEGL